jgi:Dyp-type peroxidase family
MSQPDDPDPMLVNVADVQGNILKGFNKPNVRLIFFKFGDADTTMTWLSKVAERIKSTKDLKLASEELHKKIKLDPNYHPQETYLHVSLSKVGIDKLNTHDRYLPAPYSRGVYHGLGAKTIVKEQYWRDAVVGIRDPFIDGMTSQPDSLGDVDESAPDKWDQPYRRKKDENGRYESGKIDALFIVAADNEDDLDSYVVRLIEEAAHNGITCIGLETGKALLNEQGKQVEHFGFRDGVSQPLIVDVDDQKDIDGRKNYKDVFHPKDFVLFGLTGKLSWANNGSFLAYRKLEQNVSGFWDFLRERYEDPKEEVKVKPEELAALLVGRWKSGAPLAERRYEPVSPEFSNDNDFLYLTNREGAMASNDPDGVNTPTFAHVRWANPRDSDRDRTMQTTDTNLHENNQHRMLRRGIPYGPPWAKDKETERNPRGLLFICYQRDLEQQFEYTQEKLSSTQNWPQITGPHAKIVSMLQNSGYSKLGLEHWVTTRGGDYFFSPSISALRKLRTYLVKREAEPPS